MVDWGPVATGDRRCCQRRASDDDHDAFPAADSASCSPCWPTGVWSRSSLAAREWSAPTSVLRVLRHRDRAARRRHEHPDEVVVRGEVSMPRVHLVNPSNQSFGVAVITPRWLYVLAAATGDRWGDPRLVDETLDPLDVEINRAGDVVASVFIQGTRTRLRARPGDTESRRLGRVPRIHATSSGRSSVARMGACGGARRRRLRLAGCSGSAGERRFPCSEAGRISGDEFLSARWELLLQAATCGLRADGARMSEALLVLFGVERRRSATGSARPIGSSARSSSSGVLGFRFIALADNDLR